MQRYPTHLIDVVQLADGSRVIVRPALPQDNDLQRAFFGALSEEARYFRFMTKLSGLTEDMALRFADIDYQSHFALLACVTSGTCETMIGEARYIVDEGAAAACESAIAVADDWQGMGLACTLLERLVDHAASSGIRRMTADAISANAAMIRLAERSGFTIARKRPCTSSRTWLSTISAQAPQDGHSGSM